MLDLNPSIKNGEQYTLDKDYNNASIVRVKWVGHLYALVTDGEAEWTVVKDRLSEVENA